MNLNVCLLKRLTLRVNQPYYWHVFFINIGRLLLVIILQGVPETCDSQGYTAWSVTYFCFCKSVLRNSILPQCALDCCRFFGTPCILYYTLYSLKETLRDQCTPTQKVMLLLLGGRQANLCFHFAGSGENLPDIAKPCDAGVDNKKFSSLLHILMKQNSFLF